MVRARWASALALMMVALLSLSFGSPPLTQGPGQASKPSLPAAATARPPASESVSSEPAELTQSIEAPPSTETTPASTPTVAASPTVTPTQVPFETYPDLARYIYVDQATQHMYVLEDGELVRDIPCSAGLPDADKYTPAWSGKVGEYWGTFFAYEVYADEAWYLFKSAGSILVHSLPYTWHNGIKIYQGEDALGVRPSSHGCIRVSPEDASWFTAWGPEGVPMSVSDPYRDKWR